MRFALANMRHWPLTTDYGLLTKNSLLRFPFYSRDHLASRRQVAGDDLGELIVVDARHNLDGPEQLAVQHPDVPMRAFAVGGRLLPRRRRRLGRLLVFFL